MTSKYHYEENALCGAQWIAEKEDSGRRLLSQTNFLDSFRHSKGERLLLTFLYDAADGGIFLHWVEESV
jgi:hypothetical protein